MELASNNRNPDLHQTCLEYSWAEMYIPCAATLHGRAVLQVMAGSEFLRSRTLTTPEKSALSCRMFLHESSISFSRIRSLAPSQIKVFLQTIAVEYTLPCLCETSANWMSSLLVPSAECGIYFFSLNLQRGLTAGCVN
jgi:hypothetical protein